MSEGKREALAKAAVRAAWPGAIDPWSQAVPQGCWLRVADFILAREAKRERPLVEALRDAGVRLQYLGDVVSAPRVWDAVRRWEALDAPPQRTLAEVAKDVLYKWDDRQIVGVDGKLLAPLMCELAEALKREEGKR